MQQALGHPAEVIRPAVPATRDDPDQELIRSVAAGRRDALATLYERFGTTLYRFILQRLGQDQELAEEVLQDVMLAVWQGAGRFRGDSRALTWLFGIAHRQALQARRRRASRQRHEGDSADDTGAARPSAAGISARQLAEAGLEAEELRRAVARLPEDMRVALDLTLVEGLSCREAAEVLQVATGTVKSRLFRGRALLREALSASEILP
jgi:RNA polymerase sigma factor (sigma-70 family)